MGADIHAVLQVRRDGRWHTIPEADLPEECRAYWRHAPSEWEPAWEVRNYTMFGILAGVRDHDVTPIAEPRGIPVNAGASEVGDLTPHIDGHWLGEHSYSWVTATELVGYPLSTIHPKWQEPLSALASFNEWVPWLCTLGDSDDVRLVFGFDS